MCVCVCLAIEGRVDGVWTDSGAEEEQAMTFNIPLLEAQYLHAGAADILEGDSIVWH